MDWTEEQLELATRCGATMMLPNDVCTIFNDVNEDTMLNEMLNKESEFHKHYHKGRLMQEMKVRESIFEQANNGSSPAQNLSMELINKLRLNTA